MQSNYKDASNASPEVDKKIINFCKYTFTLMGICGFLSWNVFTHIANLMSTEIYGDSNIGDSMLLIFEAAPFTAMLTLTYIGGIRPILLCLNLVFGAVCSMALALQVAFTVSPTNIDHIFLYLTAALLGLSMGATLTLGYSLSSITHPIVFTGHFSLGQSLGQISSFTAFLLGNEFFWPQITESYCINSLKKTILFLFSTSAILHLIGSASMYLLYKKPWYFECVKAAKITSTPEEADNSKINEMNEINTNESKNIDYSTIVDTRPPRKLKYLLKDASLTLASAFLWGSIFFFLYPLIVPYEWTGSDFKHNLIGVYQLTDVIVRYTVNYFSDRFSASYKVIFICMAFRALFIPPGLLPMLLKSSFFNTTLYQIFYICIFAAVNGSLHILVLMKAPLCVTRVKERGKIGVYCSFVIQFGITCGIFASKLLKIILDSIT